MSSDDQVVQYTLDTETAFAASSGYSKSQELSLFQVKSSGAIKLLVDSEKGSFQNLTGFVPMPTSAAITRIQGQANQAAITATMMLCRPAPGKFDSIQIILHGITSNANTYVCSVAPSAKFNNGWQPLNASEANQSFTPVTWGTSDRANPRNPGGGAANTVVSGTSGSSGTADLIESQIFSDVIPLSSLDRMDDPTADPLIFLRLYGVNLPAYNITESDAGSANPISSVIPGFYSGYWGGADYTASVPPGAPTQQWMPSVSIVFYLSGKVVHNIAVAGDSLEQGWIAATAVPQFGGQINGYPRRFINKLKARGYNLSYICLAQTGNKSRMFHERAINYLLNSSITHLFFKPWSVNESADGTAGALNAIRRSNLILALCAEKKVVPIILRPFWGQGDGTAPRLLIDSYIDSLESCGVKVFDARAIVKDPASNQLNPAYKTVTSGGAVVDSTHLNDAGAEAVANHMVAMATELLF